MAEKTLIDKVRRTCPPEKLVEVADFVDFLTMRAEDHLATRVATKLSEDSFRQSGQSGRCRIRPPIGSRTRGPHGDSQAGCARDRRFSPR